MTVPVHLHHNLQSRAGKDMHRNKYAFYLSGRRSAATSRKALGDVCILLEKLCAAKCQHTERGG